MYRHGRSVAGRHLVLYVFPRDDQAAEAVSAQPGGQLATRGQPRLGVSVGRRVGGAVARNRVKRLLREAFWSLDELFDEGNDYVIVARSDAGSLAEREGLNGLRQSLRELAEKLDSERAGRNSERPGRKEQNPLEERSAD